MTTKLIKAGVATIALLVAAVAAQAADMPVKAPIYKGMRSVVSYYNWSGFYAGLNAGYGFGSSDWTSPAVSNSPAGGLFGITVGYNLQMGSFVYGFEGDYNWSMMKDSTACGAAGACETENKWLATFRGRVGYAFDRWLPYVTVGGAYGEVEASNSNVGFGSVSSNQFGWTAGVGLEYAFLGNWTVKAEYLYLDLGSFDCGALCGPVVPNEVNFSANIIRAGLNYKFSGPIFSRF